MAFLGLATGFGLWYTMNMNLTDFNLGKIAVLSVLMTLQPRRLAVIEEKVREIGPVIGVGFLLTQLQEAGLVDRLRNAWVISDTGIEMLRKFKELSRRI